MDAVVDYLQNPKNQREAIRMRSILFKTPASRFYGGISKGAGPFAMSKLCSQLTNPISVSAQLLRAPCLP